MSSLSLPMVELEEKAFFEVCPRVRVRVRVRARVKVRFRVRARARVAPEGRVLYGYP